MHDVLITPNSGTLEFTASNGASIQLVVSESIEAVADLSVVGSSGTLFQIIDTFTGSLGSINNASGIPVLEAFSDNRVLMGEFGQNDYHLSGGMTGIGTKPTHKFHVSGSSTDSSLFDQTISGSIHLTHEGISYLVGIGGISITSQTNGQLLISGSSGGGGGGGTLDTAYDFGGAGAGRAIIVDSGAVQIQGLLGSNALDVTGSVDVTGSLRVDNGAEFGGSISGSIHETADGLSYLIGVGTVSVMSMSNGQIVISGTGDGGSGGSGGGSDVDWTDAGGALYTTSSVAIGTASIASVQGSDVFMFVSGSRGGRGTEGVSLFGGDIVVSGNLGFGSSSLDVEWAVYDEVSQIEVVGSSGTLFQIIDTFTGSLGGINNASGLPVLEAFSDNRVILGEFGQNDFYLSGNMIGVGVIPTHKFHVSGSSTDSSLFDQTISGSIHQTHEGLSYLIGVGTVSVMSMSNGQIIISGTGDGGSGGGGSGNTLDQAYDQGGAGFGRHITVDSGAIQLQGDDGFNAFEVTGTVDISGGLKVLGADDGGSISGSIHITAEGLSYLVAGSGMTVTSQSNGQVVLASTGGGSGDVTTDYRITTAITSSVAAVSGTVTGSISLAMAKGVVWWTRFGLNSGSSENTDLRFYSSASLVDSTLLYETLNKNLSGTYHVDGTPWSLTDFDGNDLSSNNIYYILTNSGTSDTEYTIELIAHGVT